MPKKKSRERIDAPIMGGTGHDPDKPIDQAVATRDEEPAFARSTPDAPPISPPGDEQAFEQLQQEEVDRRRKPNRLQR